MHFVSFMLHELSSKYTYIHTNHTYIHECTQAKMLNIYMHACIYIYIYIYTHTHTRIHTYMHACIPLPEPWLRRELLRTICKEIRCAYTASSV